MDLWHFQWILWIIAFALSGWLSWEDIRHRKISLAPALGLPLVLITLSLFSDSLSPAWWFSHIAGASLPASILALGALQKKGGWGDVVIAFGYGWFVSFWGIGWWLLASILPAWIEVLFSLAKGKKQPHIAFVSWISVGFWIWKIAVPLMPY